MKANVGNLDRALRIALGAALLSVAYFDPSYWFVLLGAVPLLTGLVSFCPLYKIFGISTCPVPRAKVKASYK